MKSPSNKPLVPTAHPLARVSTRASGAAAAQRWRWAMKVSSQIVLCVLLGVPSGIAAQTKPELPIYGDWDAGSRAFWGLKLQVTADAVTLGKCAGMSYRILEDAEGYGPVTEPSSPNEKWRRIAIEIQSDCARTKVLMFSIPDHQQCHADVAMFRTREDYLASKISSWGVWGNMSCSQ